MNELITITHSSNKCISVPETLHHQIKGRAISDDISISKLISEAFDLYCLKHPQKYDVIIEWLFVPLIDYELWQGWLNRTRGIYMYMNNGQILYIGNTQVSFFQRLEQHRQNKDKYVNESDGIWLGTFTFRNECFQEQDILFRQIEDYCIEKYCPIYNEKTINTKTRYKHINILEYDAK